MHESSSAAASTVWAYSSAAALAIVALVSPFLGALADEFGKRKFILTVSVVIGSLFCAMLVCFVLRWIILWKCNQIFMGRGMVAPCMLLYIVSRCAFGIADSFYNSLLIFIASDEKEMNDASSKGYILGYLGGGLLLLVTTLIFVFTGQNAWVIRIQFVVVGFWWFIFTVPMILTIKEPPNSNLMMLSFVILSFAILFKI